MTPKKTGTLQLYSALDCRERPNTSSLDKNRFNYDTQDIAFTGFHLCLFEYNYTFKIRFIDLSHILTTS